MSAQELITRWYGGDLVLGELPDMLVEIALQRDLEQELDGVTVEDADWLMWLLRDRFAPIAGHDPENYILIESVCLRPGHEEAYREDRARRELEGRSSILAIMAWLSERPLSSRPPFPADAVRLIADRVGQRHAALLASREPGLDRKAVRAWRKSVGLDDLVNIDIELHSALRRAADGGEGSQEQALAWDGFERVASALSTFPELTGAEEPIVLGARDRRAERLALVRSGALPPCHRRRAPHT